MRSSEFARFEDVSYDALLAARQQRNWLWFGLIGSLLLHATLCFYFYRAHFQGVDVSLLQSQTPTFKIKNIDLKALDKNNGDQLNPASKPLPDATDIQQPDERKSFDQLLQDIHASTAMPDDMSNVLPDKPKVEQPDATSVLSEIEHSSAQTLSNSPNAIHEQSLLNDSAVSGRPQPALSGTELATSTIIKKANTFTSKIQADSAGPKKGASGFADLDQLLSQKGPLGSGTKIRMPDDQLFAFDSAELQPSETLQKLITLLKRNPKASFTIEGYADAIGAPEYNLDLSQRRAESVRQYLVEILGIDPAKIRAHGYGATKFLVQPRSVPLTPGPELEAEIARQHLNRRVVLSVDANE
jgi:outer membrane protein OmpA-like peptidoglycan-associated protein